MGEDGAGSGYGFVNYGRKIEFFFLIVLRFRVVRFYFCFYSDCRIYVF